MIHIWCKKNIQNYCLWWEKTFKIIVKQPAFFSAVSSWCHQQNPWCRQTCIDPENWLPHTFAHLCENMSWVTMCLLPWNHPRNFRECFAISHARPVLQSRSKPNLRWRQFPSKTKACHSTKHWQNDNKKTKSKWQESCGEQPSESDTWLH